MKPLTIEQLKALEVGNWVWIIYVPTGKGHYDFIEEHGEEAFLAFDMGDHFAYTYKDYGTRWIAYKNKEMADWNDRQIICKIAKTLYGNYCGKDKCGKCKQPHCTAYVQAEQIYDTLFCNKEADENGFDD